MENEANAQPVIPPTPQEAPLQNNELNRADYQQPPVQQTHDINTITIITVLVLLFAYPIGIILMWVAAKWPKWIKFLVTLPIFLVILGIVLAFYIASADSTGNLKVAGDINKENIAVSLSDAIGEYYNTYNYLPWSQDVGFGNGNAALNPPASASITCQIQWGTLPKTLDKNKDYTVPISKVESANGWLDVSVYEDNLAQRETGLQMAGDGYTLTFNSGNPGPHNLEFINNDYVGYGLPEGPNSFQECPPHLYFTTKSDCAIPNGEDISSSNDCVKVLINNGYLKSGFSSNPELSGMYLTNTSVGNFSSRVSVCFVPSSNKTKDGYTKTGGSCNPSSNSCYYCVVKSYNVTPTLPPVR